MEQEKPDPSHVDRPINTSPAHPIPQLQGPFEESMVESGLAQKDWVVDIDAQTRRKDLLERPQYERLCGRKWRQRAEERQGLTREESRYHPLWKIISQTSFGVHLLANGQAKSEVEVVRILQDHVNEFDGFLERTTEDLQLIQLDVQTRIQYLRVPLENLDVFDEMLADRRFRLSIIDYNEKIELAITRFTAAVSDSLKDLGKGKEAVSALWHQVTQLVKDCNPECNTLVAIYHAMISNVEGWFAALSRLIKRGTVLDSVLFQLNAAVIEMQRRVGVASRKDLMTRPRPRSKTPTPSLRPKSIRERIFDRSYSVSVHNKPLPGDPDLMHAMGIEPSTNQVMTHKLAQKSVPNLRDVKRSQSQNMKTGRHTRKRSVSDSVNIGRQESPTPQSQRPSTARKLSRSFLSRMSVHEKPETPLERPSTAPARASKARSISIEHFKNSFGGKLPQNWNTLHATSIPENEQIPVHVSSKRDTMKLQLAQYFKSDKVIDAWESCGYTKKKQPPYALSKKKDWPSSVFCLKPADTSTASDVRRPPDISNTGKSFACEYDSEIRTTEDRDKVENLNTYSLKPKRADVPRIPVPSSPMKPEKAEDLRGLEENKTGDDESIMITALPSVPVHLVRTIERLILIKT
ncbi:hypothetical protein ASPZODRAFT_154761 [Penicilliopsis zonata CBS 506.65]|uniref:Uncharacterized protein n=1 Tax=Penicilliopsis zonata CBS 506.65 TaxID=1073090 RepID=A0A1L9S823_9EURO|nr:hypothetical protein ASPZODRAFT_154761 [Penicilliopsis zonata CBS 506.65]OJJ43313.1 hypothetical protein ASPZODRAFT_154761 [Penicilliopsis zonata CBS 506.65]